MKPCHRFFFVLVLTIAGSFAFFWITTTPSMVAQDLCVTNTTFVSPLAPFRSPLATPKDRRVVTDDTKWLFAHDVVDNPYEAMRFTANGFAPPWNRTSDFMIGRVVVGIILPESNGAVMPSTENWTSGEISFVTQEVNQALQWWTQQASNRGISLEFVIPTDHPITVATGYEPIKMIGLEEPFGEAHIWVNDTMAHLGYNDPSQNYLQRVQHYDDDLRRTHHADWAFTIFVINGTNDGDGAFAPGSWGIPNAVVMAWAKRPGPYTVVNNLSSIGANWPDKFYLDNIIAHEIGHVFGAADEVWANGSDCGTGRECTTKFGYLSVENQNCNRTPQCAINRPDCVMRVGDLVYLCPYSAGQVGWRDSDSDGLPDSIDTVPQLTVTGYPSSPSLSYILNYSAEITDIPYPTTQSGYIPVSINTVSVQYRIGATGPWGTAIPGDGAWDSSYEENFKIAIFDNGTYTIYLRAINRVGHTSAVTSHTITINSSEPVYRVRLPLVLRNYSPSN
ncbi:MAG: hypothetical protein QXP01_06275 [Candidatus Hadarchaeum sp.]